jgi:hypothetical protein
LLAEKRDFSGRQLCAFAAANEASNFHGCNFLSGLDLLLANKTISFTGSNQ